MKRRAVFLCLNLWCGSLGLSTVGWAQAGGVDKASAEALFNDGIALVQAGNFAEGCSKFEGSQALDPTLGTELRLADCYERLGKTASAWALFKESEGLAHRQSEARREELARARAEALVPNLSYLVIEVEGPPPPGLSVRRNEGLVPLASLGVKIPVDPGPQHITASAPSRRTWAGQVDVTAVPGSITFTIPRLELAPAPAVALPTAPMPREESPVPRTQRTVGIVTSAVGVAGILSGIGLGWYAKHENDRSRLDEYCPFDGHNGCTAEGVSLRQRAQSFARASTVTLVAGSAVLAGGIVLWATAPRNRETTAGASLKLGATASVDSFETLVGGSF